MRKIRLLWSLAVVALLPHVLPGQRTLDAGSFTISLNGQRSGREDFSIETTPGGPGGIEYLAHGTISFGGTRITPVLRADSTGTRMQYQVEVKVDAASQERWSGAVAKGRVSARIKNPRGESQREYVVADGAVILDDDVFHQYYFVAQKRAAGTVTVVIPRRNVQLSLKVTPAGEERLAVGNKEIDAQHITLTESGGATRDVWIDAQGRVLKVAIPARGLVALRDDPPG